MAIQHTCLKCGASLAGDARQGFCPKCLFLQAGDGILGSAANLDAEERESGVKGQSSEPQGPSPAFASPVANSKATIANQFGDYELLEEIGRGGMGVVYRARQRSLDRVVAIKMMAFGPGSSPELIQRFRAEAVSAASLHHPHIVAIHEVGIHEGRHFFVMDYVEGQSLARLVGNQPLPARRAAAYLQTIAEAAHYAHERGILHRDLKPSNVLINAQDQPHVVDFGLARRLEGDSELTVTGQVLGSPHYLPPEQAAGQRARVSRRTDAYALGATLYHLLTGRPPFQAESLTQTLDLVLHAEPVAPRLLNPAVPRDLETICLKCLEKEPSRRYPTAQALADELARFQASEPIKARPLGPAGKAWRWCRRKPQMASLAAAAALLFVLGFTGVLGMWHRAEFERRRAEAGELTALRNAYVLAMNSAQGALKANNPARALALLDQYRPTNSVLATRHSPLGTDLRGFEWRYLWQQSQTEAEAVIGKLKMGVGGLEVSADGHWLLAGARGSTGGVWDLTTGQRAPFAAEGALYSWGAFSPDSRWLLICDQTLQSEGAIAVWDLQARKKVAPITDGRPVGPMGFSSDGKRFGYTVMASSDNAGLVVLDFPSRKKVCELTENIKIPEGWDWAFTHDGRNFICSQPDLDGEICYWELAAGSEPRHFPGHRTAITAMAISPDGQALATGAEDTETGIRLWEVPSFRPLDELPGHQGGITALKFSPDGQTLASAGADRRILLWDVPTRKARRIFDGLPEDVWRLCFASDGQKLKLYSGSSDGTIRRWPADARQAQPKPGFWHRPAGPDAAAVAPDAKRFAALRQGAVYLAEAQGETPPGQLPELGTNNTAVLFSSDGQSLFAGTQSGEVCIWSLEGRQELLPLRGSDEPVARLLQDEPGRLLVAVHWKAGVDSGRPARGLVGQTLRFEVWTTADWHRHQSWTISGWGETYTAVSPDGRWLAVGDMPGTLHVWSLTEQSEARTVSAPGDIAHGLAFSPDGRLLAAANIQGVVKVWEMPGLHELKEFRAHPQALLALAFSPGSRRLATAGQGAEAVKLWDVATWQELITLERPGEQLEQLAFSADGSRLTALTSKGDLLFWHAPSFAEIEVKEKKERIR